MAIDEKKRLILRNLQEVVGEERIDEILHERDLNIYWGTATTGKPHLGYFVPIFKIADFLKAGCHVTILFADLHAFLDNMKSTWELLEKRTLYYEFLIKEMLKLVNVPLEKLRFVRGTDFQLNKAYTLDMYKISAMVTSHDTQKAGAEVVKQSDKPRMSGLLYPVLQALDEQYLGVDAQFGGVDQRKIFMFARENLPKINYDKRIHLMNPLIPGLGKSGKMSSSEPNSKIDFDDTPKQVRNKINKAFCVDGQVEDNGLLAIARYIIFRKLEDDEREFVIERPEQYGGTISFGTYDEVENAFASSALSSIDLKGGIATELTRFLAPLQAAIEQNKSLMKAAYPDE